MCGIAGYYKLRSASNACPDLVEMTRLLSHRGPDDEGYLKAENVGMGHRRLSIIDLTPAGHQPMANEDETVWVSYNGEIYNYKELRHRLAAVGHRFKSNSDTEVLVHGYEEWGEDLPNHLRGMFAFAIYDQRPGAALGSDEGNNGLQSSVGGRLFLARDHFGVKPLYYTQVNDTFIFASEVKALLAYPKVSREMDSVALDQYLSFLYVPEPRTIYKAIRALPPAHSLTVDDDSLEIKRYWEFEQRAEAELDEAAACQQIQEVMEDTVQAMMVADVPVGVFLSGGLDSTCILAMAARHTSDPIRTFSIGFDPQAKHWDELDAARRIASHFGTAHHEFRVEPNIIRLLPNIIRQFDQPFANPTAIILYLLAAETSQHVKVVLSGSGGDEMFAGYPRYKGMLYYQSYRQLPVWLRKCNAFMAKRCLRDSTDGRLSRQRVRRFFEGAASSFADCYLSFLTILDQERKQSLYSPELMRSINPSETTSFIRPYLECANGMPETELMMGTDLNTYLPFNQLAYGDRMSMAHSLEMRVPFVDQRVVEVSGNIPSHQKLAGSVTKGLFRKAMKPVLPTDIIDAPKRGLNLPIALWFRKDLRDWITSLLAPERLGARGYFQPEGVQSLLNEHLTGHRDHSLFLWALAVLEVWHQLYAD